MATDSDATGGIGNTEKLLDSSTDNQLDPNDDDTEKNEESWGWRGFKPQCLQWLNNPYGFLFFVGVFGLTQGMAVNTFVNQSLPTLERRFSFNSKKAGFIASANDIAAIILVSFVSFYGGIGHKPLWLGSGAIITGLGTLLFTLPQVLVGRYDPSAASAGRSLFCENNSTTSSQDYLCQQSAIPSSLYYSIFFLAQVIAGAGTTPLHTLGPAYLDENVNPKYLGIYLGVFYFTVFLGPGIGSMIGGHLMGIFIDIDMPPGPPITPADPRWMGAWWIGPLGCGILLILSGLFLLGFPRKLPGGNALHKSTTKRDKVKKTLKETLKEIIPATKSLFTNWVYICQNLAVTSGVFVWLGVGPFIYKIVRSKYGASPIEGGTALALIILVGGGTGLFIGGYIVKKRRIRDGRRAAKYTFFMQLVGVWSIWTFLIPGCDYTPYAGVDIPYHNSTLSKELLVSGCNTGCRCPTSQFRPLCGPDEVTFYSPCYAGCTASLGRKGFTNCSCVASLTNSSTTYHSSNTILTNGQCKKNCRNLYVFVPVLLVLVVLGASNAIPSKIVSLRCVPENQRAYGLGIQFLFQRVAGSLPGPIIVGYIIDRTCTLWKRVCGEETNCLNYDYEKLGWIIVYYGLPTQGLSVLFFFLSWHFSKDSELIPANDVVEIAMDTKPVLKDNEHVKKGEAADEENANIC